MSQIDPDVSAEPDQPQSGLNWDRIMALMAVVLSVTAILVSLFEVNSVREHSRATVWPHLSATTHYSSDGVAIRVSNKGVGPALVRDVAFTLDGAIVGDLDAAIKDTLGPDDAFSYDRYRTNDVINSVIAAGESVDFFAVDWNDASRALFAAWDGKADLALCYCSIQRDCWRTSLVAGESIDVKTCAARSRAMSLGEGVAIAASDFEPILGRTWTGTLSYRDYTSGQQTEIPVEAIVQSVTDRTILYQLNYPREPDYNEVQRIRISADGTRIDGDLVTERRRGEDGRRVIVTSGRSTDNNEPADTQTVYEIGPDAFDISRRVRPDGQEAYFERNRYSFTR